MALIAENIFNSHVLLKKNVKILISFSFYIKTFNFYLFDEVKKIISLHAWTSGR